MNITQRSSFSIVKVSGENLLTYLQGQVTQDIQKLSSKQALYSVILNPQGKVITDFYLLQTQQKGGWVEVMFLCSSEYALPLVERLRMFSLGYELRMGKVSSWQVVSVQGDDVDTLLQLNELPVPSVGKLASAHQENISVLRMPEPSDNGVWVMGCNLPLKSNVGEEVVERGRILRGTPMLGIDWGVKLHPLNANLIERGGVDFNKGCYVGQEVTSRMQWRGGIKKKLYRVQLDKAVDMPCAVHTTTKVGEITSLVMGDSGQYIGIALLPIEVLEAKKSLATKEGVSIEILGACGE